MDATSIIQPASLLFLALLLGGMGFFTLIMTPLVFAELPAKTAGAFIRRAFPVYSQAMAGLALTTGALLWQRPEGWALWAVCLLFLFGWRVLMPRINHHRDRMLAGEKDAAGPFNALHKTSVFLHSVQLVTVLAVYLRLVA